MVAKKFRTIGRMALGVSAVLCWALASGCGGENGAGASVNGFPNSSEEAIGETSQALINTWEYTGSMNQARMVGTATPLPDGSVLVAGGWLAFANLLATAERYDPVTSTFSAAGSMQVDRWYHAATALADGSVLVTGGETNGNVYHTAADRYNPTTNSWSVAAPMNHARRTHVSIRLNDGRVLVAGGDLAMSNRSTEIYDPATDTWTIAAPMLVGRHYPNGTRLPDGRLLVVGGLSGLATDTAEIYDPTTNQWSMAASMQFPRYTHSVTPLNDGRVLVAGGAATDGYYAIPLYDHAEIYNPATDSWSAPIYMNAARETHTATKLADGRVLLTGGSGLASTEVFDPATNSFTPAPTMNMTRVNHVAAALPDGSVLVAGGMAGVNNNSDIYGLNPAASAERLGSPDIGNLEILSLAAGASHALALVGDATSASVYSWGVNTSGRIGRTGDKTVAGTVPGLIGNVALPIDGGKKTIAAGGSHSLVVLQNGQVAAFGADASGQIGNGPATSSAVTSPYFMSLPSGAGAVAVAAGANHSLALDENGVVWAWGANADGQLGDGTVVAVRHSPIQVLGLPGPARAIAAGANHSLVILADGTVRSFGRNDWGQLGVPAAGAVSLVPLSVTLPGQAVIAEGGTNHSMVLLSNGDVYSWGSDGSGQLGNGTGVVHQNAPGAPIALGMPAIALAAGGSHSLVLLQDGSARSFGSDSQGQLGNDATMAAKQTPQLVQNVSGAFTLAAGTSYSLFASKPRGTFAAGIDDNGQLGNGAVTTTAQAVPVFWSLVP